MGVTVQGLNSLQVMDKIIAGCTERGIKVIPDYQRLHFITCVVFACVCYYGCHRAGA